MDCEPASLIRSVGIVGAGTIAPAHVKALRTLPHLRVTGVLDLNGAAAARLSARFGIPRHCDDPDTFYREARPDIVHVLTPPHTHEPMAMDALDRGVHVFIEKPMALTVDGCRAIRAKAERKGLFVGVDENYALSPLVQEAAAAIARGEAGRLVHISTFYAFSTGHLDPDLSDWPWVKALPGGVLEDLLPHALTVTKTLAGQELRLVHRQILRSRALALAADDNLRLNFVGTDGLTADVGLSLSARPDDFTVTVYGTRGTIRLGLKTPSLQRWGMGPSRIKGLSAIGPAASFLAQTTWNTLARRLVRASEPANPLHAIRAHYGTLDRHAGVHESACRAEWVVGIARQIWPGAPGAPGARRE